MKTIFSSFAGQVAALASLCLVFVLPAQAQQVPTRAQQVASPITGQPVPRFEALRFAAVNGRIGPSTDHRIVWRYERAGLPVLIVKESRDWRKIRDPDGDEVWVHARMLRPAEQVMIRTDTKLRRQPDRMAVPVAEFRTGAMVQLEQCAQGWCRLSVPGRSGWIEQISIWGVIAEDAPL